MGRDWIFDLVRSLGGFVKILRDDRWIYGFEFKWRPNLNLGSSDPSQHSKMAAVWSWCWAGLLSMWFYRFYHLRFSLVYPDGETYFFFGKSSYRKRNSRHREIGQSNRLSKTGDKILGYHGEGLLLLIPMIWAAVLPLFERKMGFIPLSEAASRCRLIFPRGNLSIQFNSQESIKIASWIFRILSNCQ